MSKKLKRVHELHELEAKRQKQELEGNPRDLLAATYQKVYNSNPTTVKPTRWRYIHISVTPSQHSSTKPLSLKDNQMEFGESLKEGLESLYGIVGGARRKVDVLFVSKTEAVLRSVKIQEAEVKAALTLCDKVLNQPCSISIVDSQSCIMALDSIPFIAPSVEMEGSKEVKTTAPLDKNDDDDVWVIGREMAGLCGWNKRGPEGGWILSNSLDLKTGDEVFEPNVLKAAGLLLGKSE
ncbi:hypothetical protein HDU98_010628 [Podochytrium sp. JEL0797]|nr:hypothetical protein HDU98_010628 [Podochytrium sp. JEL0797]